MRFAVINIIYFLINYCEKEFLINTFDPENLRENDLGVNSK